MFHPALYLATSADGRTWKTYPSPILARGTTPLFTDIVYRSTFAYEPRTISSVSGTPERRSKGPGTSGDRPFSNDPVPVCLLPSLGHRWLRQERQ